MSLIDQIILTTLAPAFADAWTSLMFVMEKGGWIALLALLGYILYKQWHNKKQDQYLDSIEWAYINIVIPEITSPSIMAAENAFNHLHGTKKDYDWREKYILGMQPSWMSFEIVSLGGVVRFIVRAPRIHVESVKAAFYAQYPNAEISEVGDYMQALQTPYNPDEVEYDFWGTELQLEKEDAYPIRTYPLFEHRAAETILDPLANLLEVMANIDSEEMIAFQILAQPSDDEWKEQANKIAKKLKEEELNKDEERPVSGVMRLSDAERNVINAIQMKLGKLSYNVKLRFLYAAPKDKLQKDIRLPEILGAFAQYNAYDLNGFKVNKYTKTAVGVKYSEKLEKKKISARLLWKKRAFINNFKSRDLDQGSKLVHMSTEEMASLYHFPLEVVRTAAVTRTEAKTGEPPINLPI